MIQQRGWDRAVASYQSYWCEQLRPVHAAVLAAADLQPGDRVVDVACGTGLVTLAAARAVGPTGRVVATDIAARMVDDTVERAACAGLTNVVGRRCGAEDLRGIAGGDADVALCALGLMYVPDPVTAVAEMARVVRPGGRVVVAVWGERRRCRWAELFPIVASRVTSDVCPMFFALGAPGALTNVLQAGGIVDVAEQRLATELVYADDESAIGAAFLGGPVALAHAHFDAATRASAHAEYLESLAPCRDGAGYRVPAEFVIAHGRTPAAGDLPFHSPTHPGDTT